MDRKLLKDRAKGFLKKFLLPSILACLIFSILGGENSSFDFDFNDADSLIEEYSTDHSNQYLNEYSEGYTGVYTEEESEFRDSLSDSIETYEKYNFGNYSVQPSIPKALINFITSAGVLLMSLVFIVMGILISNPLKVGIKRFFINGYENDDARVGDMFSVFTDGHWVGYAVKMLYVEFIIFLWTLLFIIPGIYKSYEYFYVPYILSDHPDYSVKEAMSISREMTEGKKFEIFILEISFIPWFLVVILTFGLGGLVLTPYMFATYTALYLQERNADDDVDDVEVIEI